MNGIPGKKTSSVSPSDTARLLVAVSILSGLVTGCYIIWIFFFSKDPEIEHYVSAFLLNMQSVLTIYYLQKIFFNRGLDRRLRRSWFLICLGLASDLAAELLFIFLDRPALSLADVLFVPSYILLFLGIVSFPFVPLSRREREMLALDLVTALIASVMLLWYFLVDPVSEWIDNPPALANLVYPFLDLLMIAGSVAIVQRDVEGVPRQSLLAIALASVALLFADTFYVYYAATEDALFLSYYNSLLMLWRFFWLLAVVRQLQSIALAQSPVHSRARRLLRLALPYSAAGFGLILFAFAVRAVAAFGLKAWGVFIGAIGLLGIVLCRLYLVLRENVQLYEEMEHSSREAETLDRIVKVINQETTSLVSLLNSLLEQAMVLFPQAQIGSFLLLDHRDQMFKFAAVSGFDFMALKNISLTIEEVASRYTEGTHQLEEGVYIVRKFKEIAGEEKLKHLPTPKSMLAMAVNLTGSLEGFLVFDNMDDPEAFDNSDLRKLGRFREHAVTAIAKVKTLQELKKKHEEAEGQKEEAQRQKEETEKQKERAEKAMAIIERQTKRVIETDQLKTRFFSNISHEFRTPLTLTIGPLENFLTGAYGNLSDEQRRQIDSMLRNSRRLLRLINQLLDTAKLEAGKMDLEARRANIVKFVREIVLLFASLAEKNDVSLQMNSDKAEIELYFDPDKMEKIFYNLLSNAFKFTPRKGKILVSISHRVHTSGVRTPANGELVKITVKDTGKGIPKEQVPFIFDRFRQVGHSVEGKAGTGIGLSLVKDLVSLHGGNVVVQSEPGFGSEFILFFPKGKDHLDASNIIEEEGIDESYEFSRLAKIEMSGLEGGDSRQKPTLQPERKDTETILVVEDNKDVREYIKGILQGLYGVLEAKDGEEGLRKAQERVPDLILCDVMMPKMSGYEVCNYLKKDEKVSHIPVILLTARASEEMKVEGLEVGADDYMSKPFNARELLARVRSLLMIRQQEKELKRFNLELEKKLKEQLDTIVRNERLTRYFPKKVLDRILSDQEAELTSIRKKMTVFLSELTGFTDLSDRSEPERVSGLLNQYVMEMAPLIESHGGTLARFSGDQIAAFFGAHDEMDPQEQALKAVAMAVAMHKKMKELGRKWLENGLDHNINIAMGISQDYVIIGNFGSKDLMEYTAIGSAVTLASHLKSCCTPGRIAAAFSIYALTKEQFPYEPLQELELKGFARAVRLCELDPEKLG